MEYSLLTRDDRGAEFLEPDVMTPDQFFGLLRGRSWQDGERRLMAAVLQDGIENFQKYAFAKDPLGRDIFDVGDITTARGTEMLLPIWIRLMGALQTPMFNFKIVR